MTETCSIDRCTRGVIAQHMCWVHYQRFRRHGSPMVKKRRYPKPGCKICSAPRKHNIHYRLCKDCYNATRRDYYQRHREKFRAAYRKWYKRRTPPYKVKRKIDEVHRAEGDAA